METKPNEIAIKEGRQIALDAWKKDHPKFVMPENMFELIAESLKTFATAAEREQSAALERGKEGKNILGSIYMNMPSGITFDEKANWSGTELGFMGKMSRDFVAGGTGDFAKTMTGAAAGGAGAMVGAAVGAIPSLVSKLGISGGMFGAGIGAIAAGSPMQKGAEAALGVAQNPYMEMMFSGIGFRAFQFEFIMRPRSTAEVKVVAKILKMFRTFTKPTFTEGALGKSFMDYPMEFQVEFLTQGSRFMPHYHKSQAVRKDGMSFVTNKNVPKLKNCVCDSVTSNYTPQSIWAAHDEGIPVAVTLGLNFQETELVMAEDVYGSTSLDQSVQTNPGGY